MPVNHLLRPSGANGCEELFLVTVLDALRKRLPANEARARGENLEEALVTQPPCSRSLDYAAYDRKRLALAIELPGRKVVVLGPGRADSEDRSVSPGEVDSLGLDPEASREPARRKAVAPESAVRVDGSLRSHSTLSLIAGALQACGEAESRNDEASCLSRIETRGWTNLLRSLDPR